MSFNLIQPSLIQQLKKILDQYPDDGQILKELIQNAEDAGASQVKFLHDRHSYGKEKLHSNELAKFQGPALYAYNNAEFKPSDWEGIRMLCESKKVKEPMKVGRFGLGFKSVFHVTDLPSIMSTSQIGVIDPHEKCFGERRTGNSWDIRNDRDIMNAIPDQFAPYRGVFDFPEDIFTRGSYTGTLFRFPLRTEPSKLSETLYSAEKVNDLFNGFMADAHLVLLFMQHLESIELYARDELESKARRMFQVRISEESLKLVREKRKEFQETVPIGQLLSHSVHVTYPITIETVQYRQGVEAGKCSHSFLVTNYLCGGELSSEFQALVVDPSLSYLPLVGIAMALPSSPQDSVPEIQGHVSCVLPLPVQKTSLTGLPVHVNGFFALTQNRGHIKFPTAEQEGHPLTDKSLKWNKCLLEEAIPQAYATMILEAINDKSFKVQAATVYQAWPEITRVNQKWKSVVESLFDILSDEEIVYSKVNQGQWLLVEGAIFNQVPERHLKELLESVLIVANVPVVSVPSHVMDAIRSFTDAKNITAGVTRKELKKSPACYKNLMRHEKLQLLQFCLQDHQYEDLCGLELLPLSNGTFTTFSALAHEIYISSLEHSQDLLPGLEHRFLEQKLDSDILQKLNYAARQESTQLRLLSENEVVVLLKESLPSDWSQGKTVLWYPEDKKHNHPPRDWIELIWRYVRDHFPTRERLHRLQNFSLIPVSMEQTAVTLKPLAQPSTVVIKSLGEDIIDDTLIHVLTKMGGVVLTDCPDFILDHPSVVDTFVHRPNVQGILKTIVKLASMFTIKKLSEVVRGLSPGEKRSLRSFLANVKPVQLGKKESNLMCSLPIFETFSKRFVSRNEGLSAALIESIPIQPRRELIDISGEESRSLALLLKVRILKPTEVLCEIVFPDIQSGKYDGGQIDKLMPYVLTNFAHVIRSDAHFKRNIQALPFLPKANQSKRVKGSDVFDPRNENLRKLFANENVFPVGKLYNDSIVLNVLEEVGMKSESDVTAKDLLRSAKNVSVLSDPSIAREKSHAILQHLERHPQQLKSKIDGQELGSLLMKIQWVPNLSQKTSNFPPSLQWFETGEEGGRHFFKPSELKSQLVVNLIGSVKPVVAFEPSSEIAGHFGWLKKPEVLDVAKHLQNVVKRYTGDEKAYYMALVNDIYEFLSCADYAEVTEVLSNSHFGWVWNGDGFSSPSHMLFSKPAIDLTPFIRLLPSEMMKHSQLFTLFGMRTNSDPSLLVQVLGLIKEKYDGQNSPVINTSEVRHDLQLSVDILNELASDELSPELQREILLPVRVDGNSYVRLEPVKHCMYTEQKEWMQSESEDGEQKYYYVHHNVPNNTAVRLGVPSLTHRMLDPDELSIGEEFGQEEKLTTRLNRLLEDYKDGLAVLKELLQNADDAGATEVKFLYDERTNEDAMTCLIDDGMKKCQGAALWVYNDATFKSEDFVNITKFNAATKVHDTAKIGRFGLGFNAVYNLTDVPMFVSKNYFVILDPNTSHLGTAINNRKPGMKIDLNKDVRKLQTFRNQFKPFNGVFGCDLSLDKDDYSYNGTLFRFPLRTREQAAVSEIRDKCYDDHEMRKLLEMFIEKANTVLLFTQNVFRVGMYFLPKSSGQNLQPLLMFQVNKSLAQGGILRELSFPIALPDTSHKLTAEQKKLMVQSNFLQASSKFKKLPESKTAKQSEFPESSIIIDVECFLTQFGASFFQEEKPPGRKRESWLIVSSMGCGESMEFSESDPSLLPSGGVAAQLFTLDCKTFLPTPAKSGTVFCYLPLPIHSGLPVCINGAFAVDSNRRRLQGKLEDDKICYGEEWNNVLMTDSISTAYLCLLEDLKEIVPKDGRYVFHSLWPRAFDVSEQCWSITESFYKQIANGSHALFSNGKKWVDITQVVFLLPELRMDPRIGEISFAVFCNFPKGNDVVIDMPAEVFQSFERCDLFNVLRSKTYDKPRFFRDVFFPNISRVTSDQRDVLVLYALNQNNEELEDLIINNPCIPASPDGKMLKRPSQLVNPKKEAFSLFFPDDGRFPFGDESTFLDPQVLAKLELLGMKSHDLPWEDIAERAKSVQRVNSVDSKAAGKRAKFLIEFVQKKLKLKDKGPSEGVISHIVKAEFLPVLERPKSFPLRWKSEDYLTSRRLFAAPKDVFLPSNKYLVCCSELVVDLHIPKRVTQLLRLHEKRVTTEHVMKQLSEAISASIGTMDRKSLDEVSRVCTEAYSFLQENIANCTSSVEEFLSTKPFILVGKRFLSADEVAFEVKTDCSPFLNKLPENLSDSYAKLLRYSGVKKQFEAKDYISGLLRIKQQFSETQLDEQTLQVAVNMAIQLGETVRHCNEWYSEEERSTYIYLPDSGRRMLAVADLCYKDCPWLPDDPEEHFIHEKIPWSTCEQLGVKTRREGALQQHVIGFPFGQKEELTNRLKRILTGYPGEKEILKELLQNADDAQATEICFIKDPRHHPNEKVLQESWKRLQGPALCVYNNRPFTNADIEGICNLGKGSKGEDPNKTGQYGLGFNAVYHLTDVPSFRSKGEEIGDVFCVFDPHCKYVPCASDAKPGRMYKDVDKLKKKFPDVFPCYLEELFPIKNATMFRFPLKSQEMAEESKISKKPFSVHQLDRMMKDLKMELFEILLFVNNVRKISIARIDRSEKLADIYSVEVVMTQEDEGIRQCFADYMKQVGKQAKREDFLPTSIESKKCIYAMTLRDSLGAEETWLIVQQLGFEKPVEKSIVDAFREENLGMLPRGGVACLLSSSRSAGQRKGREGKAFCFLPLPFKTNLPVYINGHFALDHEARRSLWWDEAGGYRSDWNNALLCDVIASCYLTLLDKVRGYIQLPVAIDFVGQHSTLSRREIVKKLIFYVGLFPRYPFEDSHWKTLADSVYQEITSREMRLIPVVRSVKQLSSAAAKDWKSAGRVQVAWFPPQGTGFLPLIFKDNSPREDTSGLCSTVNSEGGILVDESLKLICPPGAVDNSLSVCLTLEDPSKYYGQFVLKDLENDVVFGAPIISLEPSGHFFMKPLTLTSKLNVNFNWDDVLIFHGSKTGSKKITWRDVTHNSKIDEANAEVVIEIEHFSIIAILYRLSRSTLLRTKDIVSRLNVLSFNYTLSVLLNKSNPSSVHDELALLFVSQDVYHEQFYREDEKSSALMQLKKEGFVELHVHSCLEEKSIYNNEILQVNVSLGGDYTLADGQQGSTCFTVRSYDWWHEGKVLRIPLEWNKDVRSLCGTVSVRGEYGHTSERHFSERELCGYVRSLLGVQGAIFNVIPIAKLLEMPEESTNHLTKSHKDENEQLEIILQHWSKKNNIVEDLTTLRKDLESLKHEDYRVTERGQMHIRHLRKVVTKILGLQYMNADSQKYFIRKIQNLCKSVFRDCCIELELSAENVERAASSTTHAQYLIQSIENHCLLPQEIKRKYHEICSLFEESTIKTFLIIIPYLIQNIKDVFVEKRMSDVPQNGLRGLPKKTLDRFVSRVRNAEGNNEFFELLCDFCNILERLCTENYDKEPNAEIEKWGESVAILPMLNYLKPFFQYCCEDIRLHKRLELFSRCLRETITGRDYIDEMFVHDSCNVLMSLIHFAKIDPSKVVRFELNSSSDIPCSCPREKVMYDKLENTYSQVFRIKKETEDELQLHATARVYIGGGISSKGAFHSTIMLSPSYEEALNRYLTCFHDVVVTKQEDKDSGHLRVVFCTTQREKLLELLDVLGRELRKNVVDLNRSEVARCPLSLRSHLSSKADAVLSLRLVYKWGFEAVVLDSKDFVVYARSSHIQCVGSSEEQIQFDDQLSVAGDKQLKESSPGRVSSVNFPPGDMQIFIKMMDETVITIAVNPGDHIRNVKKKIYQLYHCPPDRQRLVFAGKRLEDDYSLNYYNIRNGSTVHLVQRLRNVALKLYRDASGKGPDRFY